MKQLFFSILLLSGNLTVYPAFFLDTYTQLQKNPGYKKMSLLEIAIERGDFEAIRYFEFRANIEELKHARVLLQNKIAAFEAIIKENYEEFLSGPEKVTSLERVEEARRSKAGFESLHREFNRKIASMDKEDAARQARAKDENEPQAETKSATKTDSTGNAPEATQQYSATRQAEKKTEYSAVL